jgi:GNAT superfamily N-acetyltransferase
VRHGDVWQSRQGGAPSGEAEVSLSRAVEVIRTYLELRSPEQLRASPTTDPAVQFVRLESIAIERYRYLYRAVGDRWYWHDRSAWTDERIAVHLSLPNVSVWECVAGGQTAGFFELVTHDDGSVEIAYFGLVEEFIGRGLGKAMLTRAAEQAWLLGASRVWLHTCTLDSPRALPNYLARGFEETRKEVYRVGLDDTGHRLDG